MSAPNLTSKLAERAMKAVETLPPFRLPTPKRSHTPKHVRTADLRMRIALKNKPRDFKREFLVITTSRSPRDALPLEKLGEWDPEPRMRRLLPDPSTGQADLSFAGRAATRYERRIELSTDKIRWWLTEGGAEPTQAAVKLLENCGILVKGEHPFSYKSKDRPVTQQKPSGDWPEYAPPTAARTPGAKLRGTKYVLPEGEVRAAHPDIQQQTDAVAAAFFESLEAKRAAEAAAREEEKAAKIAAGRARREAARQERDAVVASYRSEVEQKREVIRAQDAVLARERAEQRAAEAAAAATAAAEAETAAAAAAASTPAEESPSAAPAVEEGAAAAEGAVAAEDKPSTDEPPAPVEEASAEEPTTPPPAPEDK